MLHFKLPTPIRRLLAEGGLEPDPPPEQRIFTNRDLNLDRIPLVGFDMDYTLAIYRQEAIEALSLSCTIDKLVARGYPEALRQTDADPSFAIRGLMVDKRLGNVMKMDRHGYVGRAYHGRRPLSSEERKAVYRFQRLGQERERFAPVDTLFELPEATSKTRAPAETYWATRMNSGSAALAALQDDVSDSAEWTRPLLRRAAKTGQAPLKLAEAEIAAQKEEVQRPVRKPRPRSPTGSGINPRPRSPTGSGLNPRPRSPTGSGLNPRPRSPTGSGLNPRPRSPTGSGLN
ncbi:MAG: hypothetical protein KDK70_19075, partial [Myxococcales bacterium]|nr:hypothetical protein [Myxococcales bacterium]